MEILKLIFIYWTKGGILLLPIGCICFAIWFYLIKCFFMVKDFFNIPKTYDELFPELIKKENAIKAVEKIKTIDIHYGHIAEYIEKKISLGKNVSEIMDEISFKEIEPIRKNLGVLKALVSSSPLVGLLGTVFGMIETFNNISTQQGCISDLMALGISKALITTQYGLTVALPGLFGIIFFQRMIKRANVIFSILKTHMHIGLRGVKK